MCVAVCSGVVYAAFIPDKHVHFDPTVICGELIPSPAGKFKKFTAKTQGALSKALPVRTTFFSFAHAHSYIFMQMI